MGGGSLGGASLGSLRQMQRLGGNDTFRKVDSPSIRLSDINIPLFLSEAEKQNNAAKPLTNSDPASLSIDLVMNSNSIYAACGDLGWPDSYKCERSVFWETRNHGGNSHGNILRLARRPNFPAAFGTYDGERSLLRK